MTSVIDLTSQSVPATAAAPVHGDGEGIAAKLRAGLLICGLVVFGLGGFATVVEIAGAAVASGVVVVDGSAKKVQHPTGGIVGQIMVKDGAAVREGDVLLRLDETLTRASLMIVVKQLDELEVRRMRLLAERDGLAVLEVPAALSRRAAEVELAELVAGERKLFDTRLAARTGQKAQLRERIAQIEQEIAGLTQQKDAKGHEIGFVKQELGGSKALWEKNLYPVTKYTAIQRDAARLLGEQGQLQAQAAQARGRIAEVELQIEQIDQDLRAETMRDLRELQAKVAELAERRIAAEDQLKRVELRAPQAGIVHQLSAHTVGGVIAPGETLMQIVPQDDDLVIEARLSPADIDAVHRDQPVFIRFPAFNQRTTPVIDGRVERISADLSRDTAQQQQQQGYYVVRIAVTPEGRAKLAGLTLVPGMPAEVHLRTGDRTILSYLVKPLRDQMATAFKER
jgi:HlyD family secretion protein